MTTIFIEFIFPAKKKKDEIFIIRARLHLAFAFVFALLG